MIGVVAPNSRREVVSEFFELFKTPWEFFKTGRNYEVILSEGDARVDGSGAKLVLHYGAEGLSIDATEGVAVVSRATDRVLLSHDGRIPIFKDCLGFCTSENGLQIEGNPECRASYYRIHNGQHVARVGYDLFAEVELLLSVGQSPQFAQIPTIDLHIAFLRELIIESGADLLEIPPVPGGHPFIACLTHDIDHPALDFHKLDHAAWGFLLRATVRSSFEFMKGKIKAGELLRNLMAAMKLPFVYLGWAEDFWVGFEQRYSALEQGLPSTYFVLPFKGIPGKTREGEAPLLRASGYGARDIEKPIASIRDSGCEIATHGINAWLTAAEAGKEMQEVRATSGGSESGIRMHWLYFDEESPAALEQAGVSYDSTLGYRDTVGFRSGTTQVFKPFNTERLLELPLTVMDTALFYPAYLNLTQAEAAPILNEVLAKVAQFGGCITVNWHDRSLAPERQWEDSYRALLDELKRHGAWFATASQATSWFRKRRSVVFNSENPNKVTVVLDDSSETDATPQLRIRRYNASMSSEPTPRKTGLYEEYPPEDSVPGTYVAASL